jgi:4-amino-4-deoxy-L-arabinose transferase-like glycosyltransferase
MPDSSELIVPERESFGFVAAARRATILLALLFLLVYLPILPQVSLWRGDERYYTDAAVQMVHSGDYVTPRFFDGSERFRKPGLLYWVMAGSYQVFGVNYLTTRLPFLLAGALIILLTHACARILFRSAEVAVCAAAIMASNPTLFHLSVRSTPDVLMSFFMTLSFYGFLKILFDGDRRTRFYFIAYGAAGLAVSTKGMLGVLPVVFAFVYGAWARPRNLKIRELIHGPALLLGVGLALFWFILVYVKHGSEFLRIFFNDQVGNRVKGSKFYLLDNLVTYPVSLLVQFLPWTLMLALILVRDRQILQREGRRHRSAILFIALWLGLLFLIFVSANIQRTRYFLPALPLLAAGLGAVLVFAKNSDRTWKAMVKFDRSLTLMLGVAGVGIALAGRHLGAFRLAGLVLVVYAVARYLTDRQHRSVLRFAALAAGILLLFSVTDGLMRPVLIVSPAPELARRLAREKAGRDQVAAWEVATNYVTQLRVISGGSIYPVFLAGPQTEAQLDAYPFVICNDRRREEVLRCGYSLYPCGFVYRKWTWRRLVALFQASDPDPVLHDQRQDYYLGIRRPPHSGSNPPVQKEDGLR